MEQILTEAIPEYMKKMTGNSQHGSTKSIAYLTCLITFCDEKSPSVNKARVMSDEYFAFSKDFATTSLSLFLVRLVRYRLS